MKMKLKSIVPVNYDIYEHDFHYDLFYGGYIDPETYLIEDDAKKVREAMRIIKEFQALVGTVYEDEDEDIDDEQGETPGE